MVSESTGTARFSADRLPPVGAGLPTARRNLGMALSVVGLPLMTVLLVEVRGTLALASLLLLYLLAVVVIAVVGGTLPAVLWCRSCWRTCSSGCARPAGTLRGGGAGAFSA